MFDTPEAKLAVESAWESLIDIFAHIELGEFVVMPNHIHGIIWITESGCYRLHPGTWKIDDTRRDGQLPVSTITKFETLSNIVGAFKTTAATRINKLCGTIGQAVWQKSFYDRIVRDEDELERIHKYIQNNPVKWAADRDNPLSIKFGPSVKSINDYCAEIFDL